MRSRKFRSFTFFVLSCTPKTAFLLHRFPTMRFDWLRIVLPKCRSFSTFRTMLRTVVYLCDDCFRRFWRKCDVSFWWTLRKWFDTKSWCRALQQWDSNSAALIWTAVRLEAWQTKRFSMTRVVYNPCISEFVFIGRGGPAYSFWRNLGLQEL